MLAEAIQSLADPTSDFASINAQLLFQVAQLAPPPASATSTTNTTTNSTNPTQIPTDWLCLPIQNTSNLQTLQGYMSIVFNSLTPIDFNDFEGIRIDSWVETIPFSNQDTAYAYQYTRPNAQPPQTLLLLNPPDSTYTGTVDNYVLGAIQNTIDLAKIRTVDFDAIKWLGTFLPALFIPLYTKIVQPPTVSIFQ